MIWELVGVLALLCAASAVEGAGREPASPTMGSWFWADAEFGPGGYRGFIDKAAEHSPLNVLTTSIRARREVTDKAVHDHIAEAAAYARSRGIEIVMDLDICPGLEISLDTPLDLALWRDAEGRVRGVVQGIDGPLPRALTRITKDWQVLEVPPPLPEPPATSAPRKAPRRPGSPRPGAGISSQPR